jgi:NAD(P)-dependent dehydrogenase (short-subunit alcohol dehydrogenase family)
MLCSTAGYTVCVNVAQLSASNHVGAGQLCRSRCPLCCMPIHLVSMAWHASNMLSVVLHRMQAFLPMLRQGQPQRGRIINISSVVSGNCGQ